MYRVFDMRLQLTFAIQFRIELLKKRKLRINKLGLWTVSQWFCLYNGNVAIKIWDSFGLAILFKYWLIPTEPFDAIELVLMMQIHGLWVFYFRSILQMFYRCILFFFIANSISVGDKRAHRYSDETGTILFRFIHTENWCFDKKLRQ